MRRKSIQQIGYRLKGSFLFLCYNNKIIKDSFKKNEILCDSFAQLFCIFLRERQNVYVHAYRYEEIYLHRENIHILGAFYVENDCRIRQYRCQV